MKKNKTVKKTETAKINYNFIMIGGISIILIFVISALGLYSFGSGPTKNKKVELNLKEELLKTAKQVVKRNNLTEKNTEEPFQFVITLDELREKYNVNIDAFIDTGKCNKEDTYVIIKIENGKAKYDTVLACKNIK